MSEYITYVDDCCYDCKVLCKQDDEEHRDHNTLSKNFSPDAIDVEFESGNIQKE